MMPVKVLCSCGQKYAFDVDPVNGRMPVAVACPACGADGTAAANEIIARSLPAQPPAAPPMAIRQAAPAPASPPASAPAATPAEQLRSALKGGSASWRSGGREDRWKWWYYVLAGVCLGGYDIVEFVNTGQFKWLWELFLPVFCIFIGVWLFQRKRARAPGS
jgi:hypothetical protein